MFPNASGPPRLNRFIQLIIAAAVVTFLAWTFLTKSSYGQSYQRQIPDYKDKDQSKAPHPIDDLRIKSGQELEELLLKETHDVQDAETAYIARRGRRPPPGFGQWFDFAKSHKAVVVEDFFDRIYDDLNPFWAFTALDMRQQARSWTFRVSVRNGTAQAHGDEVERPWLNLWSDLVEQIAQYLPDLDIPINEMDESRIIAPWEDINGFVQIEKKHRRIVPDTEAIAEYDVTTMEDDVEPPPFDFAFEHDGPYWNHAVLGCAPDSPARTGYVPETDFSQPLHLLSGKPQYSYHGYVSNWTLTKSPCDNPHLQALHGTFVEPLSLATSKKLFPMFGGSKLPMNNEILLPPAMYWSHDPMYSGGTMHGRPWSDKANRMIWRGVASGGRSKAENWTRFHRHRFIAMINGSIVREAEITGEYPPNFDLPDYMPYQLQTVKGGYLAEWLDRIADAAFIYLQCFPDPNPPFCEYTSPFFDVRPSIPMLQQYGNKYLPDIDGNSFSGRYRGFLLSTSLPIKATIYDEWHDSRLVPWQHFVPMDNTFVDIYGIMEYFIGTNKTDSHDHVAEKIASDGKAWAEKVLRREDMLIYVYRLLLEYARLCDDNRDKLAWISEQS